MRALIQRVKSSSVTIDGKVTASIGQGLIVLLGCTHADTEKDAEYLAEKIVNLRIFSDEDGKMNLSLLDVKGEILVVSQFTLYGDCRKGRRPGFSDAADPAVAEPLYERFMKLLEEKGTPEVQHGTFGADMLVKLENDGPVTFMAESNK